MITYPFPVTCMKKCICSLIGFTIFHLSEEATRGVLLEKVILEALQNSQENTCFEVSFLIRLHFCCTSVHKMANLYRNIFGTSKYFKTSFRDCSSCFSKIQIKVARVVNLKLVFMDYFFRYNLVVLIKYAKFDT